MVFYNRAALIETIIWALNNIILGDPTMAGAFIEAGITKAILHVLDKIKTKTPELM
jgi:hypothetical protein